MNKRLVWCHKRKVGLRSGRDNSNLAILEARFSDPNQARTLLKRCDQILEVIQHPDSKFFLGNDEKDALKQEYNQLSHRIGDLTRGPLSDPSVFLPPEVWTDIIRLVADESDINLPPTDLLLLLTLVNSEWSWKILNTPKLWTKITIGIGEADAQAKLGLALCLSRNFLLNLTIIVTPCQWKDNLSLLQAAAHRMKSVVFENLEESNFFVAGLDAGVIQQFFDSFENLLSLKVIRATHQLQINWDDIFAKCPALSYMYGTPVPLKNLQNRNQAPIRACQIASSSYIIPHLEHFFDLGELIWDSPSSDLNIRGDYGSIPALVALRHPESTGARNTTLFRILKSTANLRWLKITIWDWQYLYELFAYLNDFPHLLVFDLNLDDELGKISLPAINPTKTGVQNLSFTGCLDWNETKEMIQDALLNQEPIFSVFYFHFPKVKRLHLADCFMGHNVAAYIRSATCLWSLTLSCVDVRWPSYGSGIKSSSLERLEITGSNYDAELFVANASLLTLTIDQPDLIDEDYEWNNPSFFNTIEYLQIKFENAQLEIPKFNALRRLRVGGEPGSYSRDGFLVSFICNTDICPLLREVGLEFIPEWDLLFLMLERRNYLPKSLGIARIETLVLPSPMPPCLLAPLTEILQGRFTKRPSDLEFSFSDFMETYSDPSISGCQKCFRSMMACSSQLEQGKYERLIFENIVLPSEQPQIPTETWEWLLKRDDRVLNWERRRKAWDSGKFGRAESCTAMKLAHQPFIITARGRASDGF